MKTRGFPVFGERVLPAENELRFTAACSAGPKSPVFCRRRKTPPNQAGFTLMENLVSMAAILIISGSVITGFSAALRALRQTACAAKTAAEALETDRFIRRRADTFRIPYWEPAERAAADFKNELRRSGKGTYMKEIESLRDGLGRIRGVKVHFETAGQSFFTEAAFASIPVLKEP
ncbi:MAG: type II secretion system GspH family protein [Treponema sp.]|nr:type II secretion system GspH family protein [Treponema sp.]